jgi:hypothetical protein
MGRKRTVAHHTCLQAVANFIVASDRCKTVRRAFVANIICKNSMPESVRLIGEVVANFIVRPQRPCRQRRPSTAAAVLFRCQAQARDSVDRTQHRSLPRVAAQANRCLPIARPYGHLHDDRSSYSCADQGTARAGWTLDQFVHSAIPLRSANTFPHSGGRKTYWR